MSTCSETTSACACIRQPEHAPPHVCACGGAWAGTRGGPVREFAVYALPVGDNTVTPDQVEAYAAELRPLGFREALLAMAEKTLALAEQIPSDATIEDLRHMTIGDLGGTPIDRRD